MSSGEEPVASPWPPVTYETLPWRSGYDEGESSRRERRRSRGPYQAAVPADIAQHVLLLAPDLAADVEDATAEVARFDTEVGRDVAPFTAILLRSESAASSQIENLTASARAIAEAELSSVARGNAAEVVANVRAMQAAVDLAESLDAEAILRMHDALMAAHHPGIAGRWRQDQVWVGGGRLGPHEALFVPPHHARVRPAIHDLVHYMARGDVPVLAQAAVSHAQFETIHPFPDGNGRTGRALVHALLRAKQLTRSVTVPVSAGLLADVDAYFDALTQYRQGEPAAIVARLVSASYAAVTNGRQLVGELTEVRRGWQDQLKLRRDSRSWELADLLLQQPVVDAALVARELGVPPHNVYRLLAPLEDAGILSETGDRRRNRVWRSQDVLAALDAFAARAGRRRPHA